MGTYAITLLNLPTRISEKDLLVQSQVNTYSTGNPYRTKELVVVNQDETTNYPKSTKNALGVVCYNETLKKHYYICTMGGGSSNIMELVDGESKWKWFKVNSTTSQGGITPDKYVYSKKHKAYYSCGAGIAEFDESTWNYKERGDGFGGRVIGYDTKRDFVLSFSTALGGAYYLTAYDPSVDSTTIDTSPGGGGNILLSSNYLHNITAMGESISSFSYLSYSEYDDHYYFCVLGALWKTHPTTGATSLVYTATGLILSMLFDGKNKYAYIITETTTSAKIEKLDLDTYLASSVTITAPLFVKLRFAIFLYVDDIVVVLVEFKTYTSEKGSGALDSYAVLGYNKDLSLDLIFQKRLFENWSPSAGSPQYPSSVNLGFQSTTPLASPNYKSYLKACPPQHFKKLTGDETEVHIPIYNGLYENWNKTSLLNINPVTQYPTVTAEVVVDCCLTELISDIKYKLAKNSCESTKRSIVGRHFNDVWGNSQLLEAVLWVTTFDCLSCNEIEKLKCIISKI